MPDIKGKIELTEGWILQRYPGAGVYQGDVNPRSLRALYVPDVGMVRMEIMRDSSIGKDFVRYQLPAMPPTLAPSPAPSPFDAKQAYHVRLYLQSIENESQRLTVQYPADTRENDIGRAIAHAVRELGDILAPFVV